MPPPHHQRFRDDSPQTQIFIQAVIPVRHRAPNGAKNEEILPLNEELKKLAFKTQSTYLDLHTPFLDEEGLLKAHYTNDDLHITGEGYRTWMGMIGP